MMSGPQKQCTQQQTLQIPDPQSPPELLHSPHLHSAHRPLFYRHLEIHSAHRPSPPRHPAPASIQSAVQVVSPTRSTQSPALALACQEKHGPAPAILPAAKTLDGDALCGTVVVRMAPKFEDAGALHGGSARGAPWRWHAHPPPLATTHSSSSYELCALRSALPCRARRAWAVAVVVAVVSDIIMPGQSRHDGQLRSVSFGREVSVENRRRAYNRPILYGLLTFRSMKSRSHADIVALTDVNGHSMLKRRYLRVFQIS